jgi:HK97 family phage major capsid protein
VAVPVITQTTANQLVGYIRPDQSGPLFKKAAEVSLAMQVGRQVPIGDSGAAIPITVGVPAADWVSEGELKPIVGQQSTVVTVTPHKISVITTMSDELLKQDRLALMIDEFYSTVGTAVARKIDAAAFYGKGSPFSTYVDQSAQPAVVVPVSDATPSDGTTYNAYLDALAELAADDVDPDYWALSPTGRILIQRGLDGFGRPLFDGRTDSLLGVPTRFGKGAQGTALPTPDRSAAVGFLGDFSNLVFGVSQGLSFSISRETALPIGASGAMESLWQRNLVAVRAELYMALYVNQRTGKEALVADSPLGNFVRIEAGAGV